MRIRHFPNAVWTALLVCAALVLAAPAHADPKADLLATMDAMGKTGKFKQSSVITSDDGKTYKTSAEVIWPDRFHIVTDQMETIIIPGKSYMKQPGQGWQLLPMDMGQMVKGFRAEVMKESIANTTNVKDLGTSQLNGKTVRGFEYDSSATVMGQTSNAHCKMWIDTATNLPVRQEVEGTAMGHKSKTVQDYDFTSPVKIEAPI
jgi:hypothetical protein